MKFVILLAACVALAAATSSRSDEETRESGNTRESGSSSRQEEKSTQSERRQRLVTRRERKNHTRHPDEIVLLNGVQQCILCRETWGEALNSFNSDVNEDGVITPDKTCRSACRGEALKKLKRMDTQEKNELLCTSCRIGIDFWRAQPSKKVHYQLAKDKMCASFTTQVTREDCEHTVRMYGFDIFTAIRNEVSSSSICHMYNLCGRQPTEFTWEEDEEEEQMEKDLESVSLDELVRAGAVVARKDSKESEESKESKKETSAATNSAEEDGVSISTERTSSEERERSIKQRRQHEREARRERRRQERKERHERERAEQARRHAEEARKEEQSESQSTEE